MVIESMYSISIISGITLRLLDIVLLRAEEVMLLPCLPFGSRYFVLTCHFEIFLPAVDFEEPLARTVLGPNLVRCMKLL
jgi:hypothetical protein